MLWDVFPTAAPLYAQEQWLWLESVFKRQLSASSIPFHSDWQIDLENEWPLSDSIKHRCSLQDRGNTPLLCLSLKVPVSLSLCLSVLHRQDGIGIEFHFHWTNEQLYRCFQYYAEQRYTNSLQQGTPCMFMLLLRPQVVISVKLKNCASLFIYLFISPSGLSLPFFNILCIEILLWTDHLRKKKLHCKTLATICKMFNK